MSFKSFFLIAFAVLLCSCGKSHGDSESHDSESDDLVEKSEGKINGHEWVDLGLPSGIKWATCNVGASSPEDYGDYYAWGETEPKSSYEVGNCESYEMSESELHSDGVINRSGNLTRSNDAARVNWGGSWRMPTDAEIEELVDNCTWTWTSQGGKNGYLVTGPNEKTIFLPAAGYRFDSSLGLAGECGLYWCATVYAEGNSFAYYLNFDSSCHSVEYYSRGYGRSVRPVTK